VAGVYAAGAPRITAAVELAVAELGRAFCECSVDTSPDGQGGVFIVLRDVETSELYVQPTTWLGFHISYLYPSADVYPHYVRPDLKRRDGGAHGPGLSPTIWAFENTPSLQVSRRSNRWDPQRDTAALKALKVLAWLRAPS
jgi:hypothetical protein